MSIADEIVDGEICSMCMLPLKGAPLGYPCVCAECYDPSDAEHNPLNPNEKQRDNCPHCGAKNTGGSCSHCHCEY